MPTWAKVVIGIVVAMIVICSGAFGACYFIGKSKLEGMEADLKDSSEGAKKFGATTDGRGCLNEVLRKNKECGDVKSISGAMCMANLNVWLTNCNDASSNAKATCDDGPKTGETMDVWAKRRCSEEGQQGNEGCEALMSMSRTPCSNIQNGAETGSDAPDSEPVPDAVPTEEPPAEGTK